MSDESERVEELENKVAELEATVRGLTEELVDATQRIRQLEAATDVDPAGDHGRDDEAAESGADATPADAGPEPMVEGAETVGDADTTKPPETEDSADADEGEGEVVEDDDIIVA